MIRTVDLPPIKLSQLDAFVFVQRQQSEGVPWSPPEVLVAAPPVMPPLRRRCRSSGTYDYNVQKTLFSTTDVPPPFDGNTSTAQSVMMRRRASSDDSGGGKEGESRRKALAFVIEGDESAQVSYCQWCCKHCREWIYFATLTIDCGDYRW